MNKFSRSVSKHFTTLSARLRNLPLNRAHGFVLFCFFFSLSVGNTGSVEKSEGGWMGRGGGGEGGIILNIHLTFQVFYIFFLPD